MKLEVSISRRFDQLLLEELRKQLPTLSRAQLKEAFQRGCIRIAGRKATASTELTPGTYEIEFIGWEPATQALEEEASASKEGSFLPIIYEDAELLVLHKTSGVPSVPHTREETQTAVGSALAHLPTLRGIGRGGFEPGLLHRLDTGTSGLLAFAKTQEEYLRLQSAWKTGEVRKIYRAIAPTPHPAKFPQVLTPWMGHDAKSAKRMRVVESPDLPSWPPIRGKALPTLTRILGVQPVRCPEQPLALSDFEIQIETGVMHQIRCTLASIQSPIVGDPIYGGIQDSRLWLHAWRLTLPLRNGVSLTLQANLPSDWPLGTSI